MRKTLKVKTLLKSRKGFSLIELVIVIAILGILAAVSITMFPRIAGTSRTNADATQANNIRTAIATYIAESGDMTLNNMYVLATGNTTLTGTTAGKVSISADVTGQQALLAAIQKMIFDKADPDGTTTKRFGPYLENKHPNSSTDTELAADYAPQGNGMAGWIINVNRTSGNVTVDATTSAAAIGLTLN